MNTDELYESNRKDRIKQAELVGDYYRKVSLHYNGEYTDRPEIRPIDLTSLHGRNLMKRALKQFNDSVEYTKDGFIKIRCRYCHNSMRINDVDYHEKKCDKRD